MQIQSFNSELALANLSFLRFFNNIKILRQNSNGSEKQIKVHCQLGQCSRIYKNWQNSEKRAAMKLPMIVVDRTGYSRNGERLNNMHNEVKYEITSKRRQYDLLTPVPIDISYDVSIIAKSPSDIDQIASNFMIFFNSDVHATIEHPKYEGIKLNNQVIMSDSISEEHPNELDSSVDDIITATFQFTFKTYLFGGTQKSAKVPTYVISSVTSSFISSYECPLEKDLESIKKFIEDHPDSQLYANLTADVTTDVTAYVKNPNLSDYTYDGFTPIIKNINIGFYPVPNVSSFEDHMAAVDSYSYQDPYVDRINWTISE